MAFEIDRRRAVAAVAACLVTATLVYVGTGLAPVWWVTWLAPLPALLLAPRVSGPVAGLAGGLGWAAGGLNMWHYEWRLLELPLPTVILQIAAPGLLFGLAVLLFRALALRSLALWSALSVPAFWAGAEYLASVSTPNGAFWSLAYTQVDRGPVVQLAAVSGVWGITFLVMAVPTGIAAACVPGRTSGLRLRLGLLPVLLLAASVGYGAVRLAGADPAGPAHEVALLAAGLQGDWAPVDTPRGREKLAEVLSRLRTLPTGTRVAVLPETAFVATSATLPTVTEPLRALARAQRMDIVAGVVVEGADADYNAAMFFPGDGGPTLVYRKQHLVPVQEPYHPGHELVFARDRQPVAGVAICKDLDFPGLARAYRRGGAEVMLVPALDFGVDGWLHGRMTVLRGVENGYPVLRTGADGELTVSDPYGRILASGATRGHSLVTVTARLPEQTRNTLYTRWGDWVAWLALAAVAASVGRLAVALRRSRPGSGPATGAGPGARPPESAPGFTVPIPGAASGIR